MSFKVYDTKAVTLPVVWSVGALHNLRYLATVRNSEGVLFHVKYIFQII